MNGEGDPWGYPPNGHQSSQPPQTQDEMEQESALVYAAMMEELGIGRKDTLPLEDRGPVVHVDLNSIKRPRLNGDSSNPLAAWQHFKPDDVDPSAELLDSIADGQLYRIRREALLSHGPSARGGQALSRGRGGAASRGGHSFSTGRGGFGSPGRGRGQMATSPGRGHGPMNTTLERGRGYTSRGEMQKGRPHDPFSAGPSVSASAPFPHSITINDGRRGTRQHAQIDVTIARLREISKPMSQHKPAQGQPVSQPSQQPKPNLGLHRPGPPTSRQSAPPITAPRTVFMLADPADFFSHVNFDRPSKPESKNVSVGGPSQVGIEIKPPSEPIASSVPIQSPPTRVMTSRDHRVEPAERAKVSFPPAPPTASSQPSAVVEQAQSLRHPTSQSQPSRESTPQVSGRATPSIQSAPEAALLSKGEVDLASSRWAAPHKKASSGKSVAFASGPPSVAREHTVKIQRNKSMSRSGTARLLKFDYLEYFTLQLEVDHENCVNELVTEKALWTCEGSVVVFQARKGGDTNDFPTWNIIFQVPYMASNFQNVVAATFPSLPLDEPEPVPVPVPSFYTNNGVHQSESEESVPQARSSLLEGSQDVPKNGTHLIVSTPEAISQDLIEHQLISDEPFFKFENSPTGTPQKATGASYYNPDTRLSSQSFNDMSELVGVDQLIDVGEEDPMASGISELPLVFMDFIDFDDTFLIQGALETLNLSPKGSFLVQLSALVTSAGGPSIATMADDELLSLPLVLRAGNHLMSIYLSSSPTFASLPDSLSMALVRDKGPKVLKLALSSRPPILSQNSPDQEISAPAREKVDCSPCGLQGSIYASPEENVKLVETQSSHRHVATSSKAPSEAQDPLQNSAEQKAEQETVTSHRIIYSITDLFSYRQNASEFHYGGLSKDVIHLARDYKPPPSKAVVVGRIQSDVSIAAPHTQRASPSAGSRNGAGPRPLASVSDQKPSEVNYKATPVASLTNPVAPSAGGTRPTPPINSPVLAKSQAVDTPILAEEGRPEKAFDFKTAVPDPTSEIPIVLEYDDSQVPPPINSPTLLVSQIEDVPVVEERGGSRSALKSKPVASTVRDWKSFAAYNARASPVTSPTNPTFPSIESQLSTSIKSPTLITIQALDGQEHDLPLRNVLLDSVRDGMVPPENTQETSKIVEAEPSICKQLSDPPNSLRSDNKKVVDQKSAMASAGMLIVDFNEEKSNNIKSGSFLSMDHHQIAVGNKNQRTAGISRHLPTNSDCDRLATSLQDLALRDIFSAPQPSFENTVQTGTGEVPRAKILKEAAPSMNNRAFKDSINKYLSNPLPAFSKPKVQGASSQSHPQSAKGQLHSDISSTNDEKLTKSTEPLGPKPKKEGYQNGATVAEPVMVKVTPKTPKAAPLKASEPANNENIPPIQVLAASAKVIAPATEIVMLKDTPKIPKAAELKSLGPEKISPLQVLIAPPKEFTPAAKETRPSKPVQAPPPTPSRAIENANNKDLKGAPGLSASRWSSTASAPQIHSRPRHPPSVPLFVPPRPSPFINSGLTSEVQSSASVTSPSHNYASQSTNPSYMSGNSKFTTSAPAPLATILVPGPNGLPIPVTGIQVDTNAFVHQPPLAPIQNLPPRTNMFNGNLSNGSSTSGSDRFFHPNPAVRAPARGRSEDINTFDNQDSNAIQDRVRSNLQRSLNGKQANFFNQR